MNLHDHIMLNARSMTIKISRIDPILMHYMQFFPNRTNALTTTKGSSTRVKTGVTHGIGIFIEQKKFVHRVFNR